MVWYLWLQSTPPTSGVCHSMWVVLTQAPGLHRCSVVAPPFKHNPGAVAPSPSTTEGSRQQWGLGTCWRDVLCVYVQCLCQAGPRCRVGYFQVSTCCDLCTVKEAALAAAGRTELAGGQCNMWHLDGVWGIRYTLSLYAGVPHCTTWSSDLQAGRGTTQYASCFWIARSSAGHWHVDTRCCRPCSVSVPYPTCVVCFVQRLVS